MDAENSSPPSPAGDTAASSADHERAPWPAPDEWPAPDATAREWAAFYRDRLGLVVLPRASRFDVLSHARALARRAVADHVDDHDREPTEEEQTELWDCARDIAERAAKGPLGWIRRDRYVTAADVDDATLDLWLVSDPDARGPRAHAHERGLCVLPGRSSKGWPLVLVDTDPRHGGDLAGAWASLPGPRASTPGVDRDDPDAPARPGVHVFALSVGGAERSSQGALAPGVDVVGPGGTPVPVPSGTSSPGRAWLCVDEPRPAPEDLRRPVGRAARKAPPRVDGAVEGDGHDVRRPSRVRVREREPDDGDDEHGLGRAAYHVATDAGVGMRNEGAGVIVGMLARPLSCPPDFVRACVELLAEYLAGGDASSDLVAREADRWRRALTRGPRDADFAVEVLETWIDVRDVNKVRWRRPKCKKVALSIWKTCDRREGGEAGAEDHGVGPPLGVWPASAINERRVRPWENAPATATPTTTTAATTPPPASPESDRSDMSVVTPSSASSEPNAGVPPPAVDAKVWRGGIDPTKYVLNLGEYYTPEALARDLVRRPVDVDDVMPLVDFASGRFLERDERPGMGWGPGLDAALRGFSPGDARFIAAAGAGAGKTWFECFLANGLALATACRALGYEGFERTPVVLPIWVSEMPKKNELALRLCGQFFGFDMAAIADGERAERAPGVIAHARSLGGAWSPAQVVRRARLHVAHHYARPEARDDSPLGFACHRLIKVINISALPPARGRFGAAAIDHQSGPVLVDHIADAVVAGREEVAALLGVPAADVLPLVLADPGQRFGGHGHDQRALLEAFFSSLVRVLCGELECAVLGTLDTTKDAVANVGVDAFLGGDPGPLASKLAAGSQAIIHNADVLGLCAEQATPADPLRTTQWCRVLKGRNGSVLPECYPFDWEMSLGRFRPRATEPVRPREADGEISRGGKNGRADPPPRPFGTHPNGVRHHPAAGERRYQRAGETDD